MRQTNIPKIIHQISIDENSNMPDFLRELSDTWKNNHPTWQYELWNREKIISLFQENFSEYNSLTIKENWDEWDWYIVKYFILYIYGGLYVKYDCESLENIENKIKNKSCFLSYQPTRSYNEMDNHLFNLSDSFIGVSAKHPFIKHIISHILEYDNKNIDNISHNFVLTEWYNKFEDKKNIHIFNNKIFFPLTQEDIRLYLDGKIEESIIEEKIKEAVALCYYYDTPKRTKILYFSASDGDGGAFNAAYRIHCSLLEIGIESKMLVQRSVKKAPNIFLTTQKSKSDKSASKDYGPFFAHSSVVAGINIKKHVDLFNPEIVQLHWINDGFIKIEDLKKIKRKIVWRLPDCCPFTGGCYYFGNCSGYTKSCGKCPLLNSDDETDISYKVMQRKTNAWKDLDMTIVVPSRWMKNIVEKSSLFCNRRIEIIPNGLNIELFYPLDKFASRKVLNLPFDKKIILFGAYYPFSDIRKGYRYLKQALNLLSNKYNGEIEIIIFGAEPVPASETDLPIIHLGKFTDELSLRIIYSCADVMVVPSTEEAFGQTASEALACGTPVVVFENTGPEDIVDHKLNGFIAKKENYESLAEGIAWIISDDEKNKRLSQNARQKAEDCFDYRKTAKSYQSLYDSILKG